MRRTSMFIATATSVAFLTQIAATHATTSVAPADQTVPSASEVLADIDRAVADQPTAPDTVPEGISAAHAAPGETDLPEMGSQPAEATASAGTLTLEVPATGPDLAPRTDATAVFDGTAPDTAFAVQNTTDGLRALVHIESPNAPERFRFPIGGDVTRLRLTARGGVEALNQAGMIVMTSPPPWATDASGSPVRTRYEINGTTLTQVVRHRAHNYTYGIVADPSFFWWAKNITKCAVGVAGFLSGPGAVTKIAKLKKLIRESKALKAVVDRAGGITKLLGKVLNFVKSRGKVSAATRKTIKELAKKGGYGLLGLVSGGCLEIVRELV